MTGYPEHNFPAFRAAAADIRRYGIDVVDPSENDGGDASAGDWAYFMRQDIQHVLQVDAVVVLPGWEDSYGACFEAFLAYCLKLPTYYYDSVQIDWEGPVSKTKVKLAFISILARKFTK